MIAISMCKETISAFTGLEANVAFERDCYVCGLHMLIQVVDGSNERALVTVPHAVGLKHLRSDQSISILIFFAH